MKRENKATTIDGEQRKTEGVRERERDRLKSRCTTPPWCVVYGEWTTKKKVCAPYVNTDPDMCEPCDDDA